MYWKIAVLNINHISLSKNYSFVYLTISISSYFRDFLKALMQHMPKLWSEKLMIRVKDRPTCFLLEGLQSRWRYNYLGQSKQKRRWFFRYDLAWCMITKVNSRRSKIRYPKIMIFELFCVREISTSHNENEDVCCLLFFNGLKQKNIISGF